MLSSFRNLCKYIYETIHEKIESLYGINKHMLEDENMFYCKMQDGDLPLNIRKTEYILEKDTEKEINRENNFEKIKSRMESYKK